MFFFLNFLFVFLNDCRDGRLLFARRYRVRVVRVSAAAAATVGRFADGRGRVTGARSIRRGAKSTAAAVAASKAAAAAAAHGTRQTTAAAKARFPRDGATRATNCDPRVRCAGGLLNNKYIRGGGRAGGRGSSGTGGARTHARTAHIYPPGFGWKSVGRDVGVPGTEPGGCGHRERCERV